MRRAIVDQANAGAIGQLGAIKFGTNDAATYMLRILDRDFVCCDPSVRTAMAENEFEAGPCFRDAGIEMQGVAVFVKSKYGLDAGTI